MDEFDAAPGAHHPVYAALVTQNGRVVGPDEWEPLLDAQTHAGLVAFLGDPARKRASRFERKHTGSGIYVCAKCGNRVYAAYPQGRGRGKMLYICKPTNHVARLGNPLDKYVESVVLGVLAKTDIRSRLTGRPDVDVDALHSRRAAIAARLDELAAMFAEGSIDASQLRRGTSDLRTQLAGVDAVLAELARTSPAAKLLADGPDTLAQRWAECSADIRGKIIDELCTVTIHPAPKGSRFDPAYVSIKPKFS